MTACSSPGWWGRDGNTGPTTQPDVGEDQVGTAMAFTTKWRERLFTVRLP